MSGDYAGRLESGRVAGTRNGNYVQERRLARRAVLDLVLIAAVILAILGALADVFGGPPC